MRRQLRPALRMLLILTVLLGVAYPLAMTAVAQIAFGDKADGSLIEVDGEVVGSHLLGQEFQGPGWFHSRPSAAGPGASGSFVPGTAADGEQDLAAADVADAANNASGSSNLGPTNPALLDEVTRRADEYRTENGLGAADAPVPVDAVTASGSGVDPHISVANARLQVPRVARERDLPEQAVRELISIHTDARALGFLGEPGVNVLELNLAIEDAAP